MQRLVLEWTVQQQLDDDDDDNVLIPELTSSITQWLLRWSLNGRHFPIAHHVPVLLFKYKQTLEKLILLNHQIPLKINRVLDGDHHRCERHTPRGLHPCWEVLEETLGFVLRIRTIPIKTNNYDCEIIIATSGNQFHYAWHSSLCSHWHRSTSLTPRPTITSQ